MTYNFNFLHWFHKITVLDYNYSPNINQLLTPFCFKFAM